MRREEEKPESQTVRGQTVRVEEKKINLRFPQTFEATAIFSIHINRKRFLPAGWFKVRKPLDGAYAPSTAPLAEGKEVQNAWRK